jgi:hypothetical protein
LELHLTQGCITGVGNVKLLLWNSADSAASVKLVTVIATVTQGTGCPTGIAETGAAQFALYPDPVKDQLKITLPKSLDNGRLEIFNLLGSKVFSQPINGSETMQSFDLSGFEGGLYVAVISENGKLIGAQKFTRQE